MKIDATLFDSCWQPSQNTKQAELDFWNCRAAEFNAHKNDSSLASGRGTMLALLHHSGMLSPQHTVLEICCGTGHTAIELAQHAQHVTGTDFSENMVAYARQNAATANAANVTFVPLDWHEANLPALGWEQQFDLVMAIKCPAINSRQTLEKMMQASRGHCFLSSFVARNDSIRTALRHKLGYTTVNHNSESVYYAFNILWHMGFYPELTYIDTEWEHAYTYDEAVRLFTGLYSLNTPVTPEQHHLITSYLQSIAINGMVYETATAKIAWMYWNVRTR